MTRSMALCQFWGSSIWTSEEQLEGIAALPCVVYKAYCNRQLSFVYQQRSMCQIVSGRYRSRPISVERDLDS